MTSLEKSIAYYNTADDVENLNAIFRKVYQYMALGLILTALTAYFTAASPAMIRLFYSSPAPLAIVAIVEVVLVLALRVMLEKISTSTALIMFAIYSVLNGVLCSSILLVYTQESVFTAFLSTATMFGAMSLYGLYTKRDLSSMGSFLRMGLFGLLAALVINLFLASSAMDFYISIFGVIIFAGLTAYDTAMIKELAMNSDSSNETLTGRLAIVGALELYLDFINMFIYLVRIMGKFRDL